MDLATPLSSLAGVGPNFASRLSFLNLNTIEDLLYHFPFRYEDFSNVTNLLEAQVDQNVTLQGELWSIKNVYTRSRKIITQAIFNDGTAPIELTWFNQSWLTKSLFVGDKIQISGKITKYKNKFSIVSPKWEKMALGIEGESVNQSLHTGKLVPIYSETMGITSKWIRAKVNYLLPMVLPQLADPLPVIERDSMVTLAQAIKQIHQPASWQEANQARERLGFDELLLIQLATQKARHEWQKKSHAIALKVNQKKVNKFIKDLPFELTNAQKRVIEEICVDIQKDTAMNRLVQGEVGSGKTVVAAVIAYITTQNKLRTILMAPTEILAFQHYANFQKLLEPLGITVGIYTGSRKFTKKAKGEKPVKTAKHPDILIGTHALLSAKLLKEKIGLVVVDEQQRFGVEQRSLLRAANEQGNMPHFLTMTATPIPRTVALTLYGDLDLSIIDELPKGRQAIKTNVVPNKRRDDAYTFIAKKVKAGDQVYIVTPLIEESETNQSAKAAKVEFERLRTEVFPNLRLGLLHGQLKPKEKEQALLDFKANKLDILVSTSVVEVGVDVPNATIMLIEGAERFGLAQLHQLRGRIGRGAKESFCLLFTEEDDPSAVSRLKNLETNSNGLKLAEIDLKIRGSGEIFGRKQSGRFELKIASLSDLTLIEKTKAMAQKMLLQDPSLDKYPLFKAKLHDLSAGVMPD